MPIRVYDYQHDITNLAVHPEIRARVWTLCLCALVLCALTDPVAAVLAPLAHASSPALPILAAILAATLVGTYIAIAVLLARAVLRVVRLRLDGHR